MRRCSSVCSIKSLVSFTFDFSTSAGLLHGRLPVGFIIRKELFADVVLHMSCYVNQMNEVCFAGSAIRFMIVLSQPRYAVMSTMWPNCARAAPSVKYKVTVKFFAGAHFVPQSDSVYSFGGSQSIVDRIQMSAFLHKRVARYNAGTLSMLGLTNLQDLTGTQPGILGRCSRYRPMWLKWRRR